MKLCHRIRHFRKPEGTYCHVERITTQRFQLRPTQVQVGTHIHDLLDRVALVTLNDRRVCSKNHLLFSRGQRIFKGQELRTLHLFSEQLKAGKQCMAFVEVV